MSHIIKIIVLSCLFVASSQAAVFENWAGGEPNNSGNCGWIYSNGTWDDAGCDRDEPTLCYSGKAWILGYPTRGFFGGVTNTDPEDQCANAGAGYKFAAPYNAFENEVVREIVANAGVSRVRINLAKSGGNWASNAGVPYITRWFGPDPLNFDEPDDGGSDGNQDCVAMDRQGYWHDVECTQSLRFVCAQVGSQWYISASANTQEDLYAGERACRSTSKMYTFEGPASDNSNVNIVNRLSSAYANSATYGDMFWVNVNDRLTEGLFQTSENRYFWRLGADSASSEPNNSNNEDCVEKNSGSEWNDVSCTSAAQKFACFHLGTKTWKETAVTSSQGDDFIAGAEACQAEGPQWSFWAPHTPSQNSNAPQNAWFNITDKAVEGSWQANNRAYFWGKTDLYNKNDDGFYIYQTNIVQPNNGGGNPKGYDRRIPELNVGDNEDCAVQLGDGTWHDLPCSNANGFACYDKDGDEWRIAGASPNLGVFFGESKCQALESTRRFHFTAPENRQQQNDLSSKSGTSVWINATDRAIENTWAYNEYLTFWNTNEPVIDDAVDCAVSTSALNGKWEARACNEIHEYLCKSGNNWVIAPADSLENKTGIVACGNNIFAAPSTFDELESLKAFYATNPGAEVLWINATDSEQENNWQYNQQRFWAVGEPDLPSGNATQDCAVLHKDSGLWTSEACTGTTRQYLCFDASNEIWALANTSGVMANFSDGQNACEALNATKLDNYLFSAPKYTWENAEALALLAVGESVWINGNDRIVENRWVFNEFLYWSATALDAQAATNDCLTMNAQGYWQDTACDAGPYKVACFSGDGWYLSPETRTLSNFSDAQRACNEIGNGYRFFAPISVEHNRELRQLVASSENIWINGIDIAEEGRWVFNSIGLPTPNWASSQPNGELAENCAYIDADGLWHDSPCTEAKNLTCLNSGGEQFISTATLALTSNFDAAHQACINEGGISFFAPTTFNQNEDLRQLMNMGDQVWLNVADGLLESRWALNIAATADYNTIIPDTSGIDGCASLGNDGLVTAGACNPAQAKVVTCYDGNEWRISNTKVVLGSTATDGKLIRNAFAACQAEFSGDFTFAVPRNTDALAKWELAQALALSGADSTWLNLADWYVETAFSANMPYQNLALSAIQIASGCGYVDGQTDGWLVAQQCDETAAHFACYNGSTWQIAPADGTIEQPSTPQLGVDGWDQSYGDLRCKEFFGPGYNFSAPITPREDTKLQQLVSRLDNSVKTTWINYYANRFMSGNGQQWFADRINMAIFDGINLDQGSTTEDCGALTNTAGQLLMSDETCSEAHKALCYNGASWFVTSAPVQWNQASAECGQEFDEEHIFALPRDEQERTAALSIISNGSTVWTNYSDLSVESKWRANAPLRQWWADSEPTNLGNRDCVVLDSAGPNAGLWRSDYCDQVFHNFACKNGKQWQVTSEQGIWAQGFTECRKLGDGWFFDYPEDYFANLNAATTLSSETNDKNDFDNGDIQSATNFAGKSAWINLTDQYREKDWQRGRQFSDWAINFAFDDNRDCAYMDTSKTEVEGQSVRGSWAPGLCYGSDSVRKFACTNGASWVLADATGSDLGSNWNAGFAACTALGAGWEFSAPVTSFDNERLKAALGQNSAWINLQDVGKDGDWAANLSQPNLPPVIKFSTATASVNTSPVDEKISGLQLQSLILDPEGMAIQSVVVTEENGLASSINIAPCTGPGVANGICESNVTYTAPALTNIAKELKFKFVATDAAGNSTFTYLTVEVLPPIIAWYDFDDENKPNYDKTGNGNDAIDNPEQPYDFPPVNNGALDITQGSEKMTVDGSKLAMPKDYAVALRVWADAEDEAEYQQFQIEFLLANGDQTGKCFDLPGSGVGAAVNNANVSIYACDGGIDQLWYQDADGLIHSGANPELCLAHPGDGNDLSTNLRNVQISYCSNVQHPWLIHLSGPEKGAIESTMHSGYFLYAVSSNNDTNVVLTNTAPTRKWLVEKTFGRGILQKGPVANQPLLTFGDKTSYLTYTVGEDSGTSANPLAQEQWVNVVVNVEGTSLTVYIDGIAETPVTLASAAVANNDDLIIGNIPSALRSFIGRIDEVQVFSRPLTIGEIVGVLPEPPVGLVQFEASIISRQEPQIEGGALVNPILVRRTDGSNGQLKATVRSLAKSANEGASQLLGVDYLKITAGEQELIWKDSDAPLYLTPEYDLLPLLSAAENEAIDSVELDRTQPVFVAIDLSIPVDPVGIVWEQGGSGRGSLIGFNAASELIIRAGDGQPANAATARIIKTKAYVDANLVGKTGTLIVEIDPTASVHSVKAWFKEGGLFGTQPIVAIGENISANPFTNNEWQGGDGGMLGNINSGLVAGEFSPYETFDARYIRNTISGSDQNGGVHWVEIQAFDALGSTNVAAGITAITTNTAFVRSKDFITNGNLDSTEYAEVNGTENTPRWVQIDLGSSQELSSINVRHYSVDARKYFDNKTEYSVDGTTWFTIADFTATPYVETSSGKTMDVGLKADPGYDFNGVITMGRFYDQKVPQPIERIVDKAKLIGVTLYNENPFDREPTERLQVELLNTERRATDADNWQNFAEGATGILNKTEVALLDYTKNPAGILQFAKDSLNCTEPHVGDNDGIISVNGSDRYYRTCSIEVQRRTGGVGEVEIEYGINTQGLTYSYVDEAASALDTTDVLFSTHTSVLNFPDGIRSQTIAFNALSDLVDTFENNESFILSLFNPRNITTPDARPWMGDPIGAKVTIEDYALGTIEMAVANANAPEPRLGEAAFNIHTIKVLRRNGSNGPAEVTVTATDGSGAAVKGTDYHIVDVDGVEIAGAQTLTWADGESASLPIYVKVYSDQLQEYVNAAQGTNATGTCYDSDGNGVADVYDRDCFASESFTLTLAHVSGAPLGSAGSSTERNTRQTNVFLLDNTEPADLEFTSDTIDMDGINGDLDIINERLNSNAINDVGNDGIYTEANEGALVPDVTQAIKVTRSNRYSEHAVFIEVTGADGAATLAASVGADVTLRAVNDVAVVASTNFFEDPSSTGSDQVRKFLLIMPLDAANGSTPQTVTVNIEILDNNRTEAENREAQIRMYAAGDRDKKVITFPVFAGATEEVTNFQIADVNILPTWTDTATAVEVNAELGTGNLHTYTMPIKAGGSMKLDSRVPFGAEVISSYRIKAFDPDWITINYEVSVDNGPYKAAGRTDVGGYLSWTTAMNDVWNFIAPNTKISNSYNVDIDIRAKDTDGEEINTTANVTLNLAWRKIRLAASNECIFKTGNTIEWDYGLFGNKCENTDNYYWAAIPVESVNDAYQLINKSTKTCLYKLNGSDGGAGFRTCEGGAEEYWYFDRNGAGDKTIQRWDAADGAWEYLCGNIGDGIDIKVGGSCSWDDARWK